MEGLGLGELSYSWWFGVRILTSGLAFLYPLWFHVISKFFKQFGFLIWRTRSRSSRLGSIARCLKRKMSQKKNLRRWLSSWPACIIGKARQGLPLAHLPVGTVVSTARLGNHSVGETLAFCPLYLLSILLALKLLWPSLTCRPGSQFFISFWQAEERKIWNYSFNFKLL